MEQPDPSCEDCNGTGMLDTQLIHFSREYWSREHKSLVCDIIPVGEYRKTVCHCIEERDEENTAA